MKEETFVSDFGDITGDGWELDESQLLGISGGVMADIVCTDAKPPTGDDVFV